MTQFFVFAALLIVAGLAFVLVPLWRAHTPTAGKRRETNILIYHQRYAEIEREVVAGSLSRRRAEEAKDDLGARLLADIDETPALADDARPASRPWVASLLVVSLLVGGAGGGYWVLGGWQAISAERTPDMSVMLRKLERRVEQRPDDFESRAMLAKAQEMSGDYAGAARNYRRMNAAMPQPRRALIAAEAHATLLATDDLQGRVSKLYRQLLELDGDSVEALWYLGLGAAEQGANQQAIQYWERLLQQDLPDDFRARVRNRLNELMGKKPGLGAG